MEKVIVEIPEDRDTWEPPVLKTAEVTEPPKQSAADVIFAQYIVCVLLLTAMLLLRVYDETAFDQVTGLFRSRSGAPSEPWAAAVAAVVQGLWS
ncbi:MAG: hypothetical protein IKN55_10590 [Oscillospiraceae bacterium]|nr:hypothetical protein [Oscillospiraceae bacterium]